MENKVELKQENNNNNEVKKVSEMTIEEIKSLDSVKVRVVANVSKTGSKYYSVTINFNSEFSRRISIEESDYLLLTKIYGKNDVLNLQGKIRIFKGTNNNGNDWYSFQLILTKDLMFNDFFKRSEIAIIKIYLKEMAKLGNDFKIVNPAEAIKLKTNEIIPIFNYKINLREKLTDEDVDLISIWGE